MGNNMQQRPQLDAALQFMAGALTPSVNCAVILSVNLISQILVIQER